MGEVREFTTSPIDAVGVWTCVETYSSGTTKTYTVILNDDGTASIHGEYSYSDGSWHCKGKELTVSFAHYTSYSGQGLDLVVNLDVYSIPFYGTGSAITWAENWNTGGSSQNYKDLRMTKNEQICSTGTVEDITVVSAIINCSYSNVPSGSRCGVVVKIDEEDILEPAMTLKYIHSITDKKCKDIFVLEDFNAYIEEEDIKYYLRQISHQAKYTNTHVIILSAIYKLPIELEKYITVLTTPLPDRKELEITLREVERDCKKTLSIDLRNKMVDAALGMTTLEASLAFSLAAVTDSLGANSQKIVSNEKEQIIKKSGMLEYFPKNEDLKDVGGMEQLKKWLYQRRKAYEKRARDWGLKEPKGLLLLGVPGCGKSLIAKCIASNWNLPLLRLDIGKVYQGLMGSSEANIRKAIATAEAVAPCVLWIDEIEKGLNGT
jgi:hypothetical protein